MNFKLTILASILIFLTAFLIMGCEKEIPIHDIDVEIQKVMKEMDLPSISACVINNNSVVWSNYYGHTDKENQVKASENSIYHIASISKLFISTSVMQLAEQGLLDIDEDINNYIPISIRNPNFPDIAITPRMLLTHSAGIAWPQYYYEALGLWEHFDPDQAPAPSEWAPLYLVPSGEYFNNNIWKNTRPGEFELYSNIGSNVLAYLVEQVSGQNFRDYCMDSIFIPLSMHNTSYNFADIDMTKIAILYKANNSIQAPFDDRIYASGGLKTTILDLSRFLIAIMNKGELDDQRILMENSIEKLLEIQNLISGTCLIWNATLGGWYGHSGGMDGVASIAEIHPKSGTGFIIFCNKRPSAVYRGKEIYSLVKQKANEYLN